jgi:hypothetical protein
MLSLFGSPLTNLSRKSYVVLVKCNQTSINNLAHSVERKSPVAWRRVVGVVLPCSGIVKRVDGRLVLIQVVSNILLVVSKSYNHSSNKCKRESPREGGHDGLLPVVEDRSGINQVECLDWFQSLKHLLKGFLRRSSSRKPFNSQGNVGLETVIKPRKKSCRTKGRRDTIVAKITKHRSNRSKMKSREWREGENTI